MSVFCAIVVLLGVDAYQDTFERGNTAYDAGEYEQAVQSYEKLIESSVVNPIVFYNLGNAYYRDERLGKAIVNYERVLALDPSFEEAIENLENAVRETERGLSRPVVSVWEQSLLFWHHGLSYNFTRGLSIGFWLLFWMLLAVCQWRRRRFLGRLAVVAAILVVLFGASTWVKARPSSIAVAFKEVVSVRFGSTPKATIRFELYDGDRVLVDQQRRTVDELGNETDWARITTVTGDRGWVLEEDIIFVGPPYRVPSLEHNEHGPLERNL